MFGILDAKHARAASHSALPESTNRRCWKYGLPVALHADDRDAVLRRAVERLGERAQLEIAVVGELALGIVVVQQQREARALAGLT